MHKDANGYIVYERLEELLNADVRELYEDSENFYFRLKPDCNYDNGAWAVNKRNHKVSFVTYTDVMFVLDTKQIDISTLKKRIA